MFNAITDHSAIKLIDMFFVNLFDPVKIYAQICLQTPADLKSAGNSGVVHDRL